jgi:hypothetical protein
MEEKCRERTKLYERVIENAKVDGKLESVTVAVWKEAEPDDITVRYQRHGHKDEWFTLYNEEDAFQARDIIERALLDGKGILSSMKLA